MMLGREMVPLIYRRRFTRLCLLSCLVLGGCFDDVKLDTADDAKKVVAGNRYGYDDVTGTHIVLEFSANGEELTVIETNSLAGLSNFRKGPAPVSYAISGSGDSRRVTLTHQHPYTFGGEDVYFSARNAVEGEIMISSRGGVLPLEIAKKLGK